MNAMILSDAIPITAFAVCACFVGPSLTILGIILSRVGSLIYHLLEASSPSSIINLDYIGICCMSLAAIDADSRFTHSKTFQIIIATQFAVTVAFFCICWMKNIDYKHSQLLITALAIVGNYPAIITSPSSFSPSQRILFATSPILFAIGFAIVKPFHHIAWHWIASAAQGILLAAVLV